MRRSQIAGVGKDKATGDGSLSFRDLISFDLKRMFEPDDLALAERRVEMFNHAPMLMAAGHAIWGVSLLTQCICEEDAAMSVTRNGWPSPSGRVIGGAADSRGPVYATATTQSGDKDVGPAISAVGIGQPDGVELGILGAEPACYHNTAVIRRDSPGFGTACCNGTSPLIVSGQICFDHDRRIA